MRTTTPIFSALRRTIWKRNPVCLACLVCLLCRCFPAAFAASPAKVTIVHDDSLKAPVQHGLEELRQALQERGVTATEDRSLADAAGDMIIVAGLVPGASAAADLAGRLGLKPFGGPESFAIRKTRERGKTCLLVAGSDAPGLMYGLLEVAERVGWAKSAATVFSEVREADEKAFSRDRAMSVYTMHRAYWESRFYDEAYWTRYFDIMARNRFNSFVLIFGYENGGFLAPAYPYFFDVEEFPEVRMAGLTSEQQERNLAALNRLIQLAHERGLSFTIGLWDHIYRGGVQGGGIPGAQRVPDQPTPGLVWGVTSSNLTAYTCAALTKFIRQVHGLDAIQFRMHDESGLKNSEQVEFWRHIFGVMKEQAPNMRFDARAKGLPDSVIDIGLDMGVNLRITTKFWMEQMGLPFHPTHINTENQYDRRHSYADLLRYPQRYKLQWRLWNGGTARVLLWGDPDYARRFIESCRLYDGDGFDVDEPLCTKMEAQPHDAKPFDLLQPAYRYYDYEFERYWHLFQVFGRLGYDPQTPPEVWQREFERRFGKVAAPFVEAGLHRASQVLPRIVAACYPYSYFPMTRGWAEKQRLGDLAVYAKAEGSDIQQFANFDEEAQMLLSGGETAKIRPPETSAWLAEASADIMKQITAAEKRIGNHTNKEFVSTITDLKILAGLALYHSRRIPAAVSYRLYDRTKDPRALDEAISNERKSIEAWRLLVEAAGDVYSDDLKMGVRTADLCGHWKDELGKLEKGLAVLEQQRQGLQTATEAKLAPKYRPADSASARLTVSHQGITRAPAGKPLPVVVEVRGKPGIKWVRLRYRSVNQELDYKMLPMLPTEVKGQYRATIPAEDILPKWDLMYFIEVMDQQGNGQIHPDLNKETPYFVVSLER